LSLFHDFYYFPIEYIIELFGITSTFYESCQQK